VRLKAACKSRGRAPAPGPPAPGGDAPNTAARVWADAHAPVGKGTRRMGLVLACLTMALPACERGCLSSWLSEHQIGGHSAPGMEQLRFVDCPDGLARCVGGVVEVSRLARHPEPCSGSTEACSCPWDKGEACASGCVAEDVEVVLDRARGRQQLCAPAKGEAYAIRGAPGPAERPPCGDERYRCTQAFVFACDPAATDHEARAVAQCLKGCAASGMTLDDDRLDDDAAMALLCARGP